MPNYNILSIISYVDKVNFILFSPINDSFAVKKLKTAQYFGSIKSSSVFCEFFRLNNVKHEITAVEKLHKKKEKSFILKSAKQISEKRILRAETTHVPLQHCTFDVVVLKNSIFFKRFHCIKFVSRFTSN